MIKPTLEAVEIYETVTQWIPKDKFNIERVKTDNSHGVPYNLLRYDYLYRVTEGYEDGESVSFCSSIDDDEMENMATRALMLYGRWPCSRTKDKTAIASPGHAHFIEEYFPREMKWDPECPSSFMPHYNILAEELEVEEDDYPNWLLMSMWLDNHYRKCEQVTPDDFAPF